MVMMENRGNDIIEDEDLFSKFDYELEQAKKLVLNSLASSQDEKDTKSSDSTSKTIKELQDKLAKVESENRKLSQKNKELTEWKNKHKNKEKELEDKLSAEIREKNSALQAKETINEKLIKEIERRDRIFELCSPTQSLGIENEGVEVREENEVTMNMSPGGHRTYEIKNKQKVPYWIKIERLSPKCWEKFTNETDIPDETQNQDDNSEPPQNQRQMGTTENHNDSSSDESEYSRFDIARKSNGAMLNQSGSGSTKSKLRSRSNSREIKPNLLCSPNRNTSSINSSSDNFKKETSAVSSTSRAANDSRQNKDNSNTSTPSKASSSTSHKRRNSVSPKRSFKIQKRSSRDSIHSRASSTATNRSSDEKSESRCEVSSLVSTENVIDIPESLRINYGFPDSWELDDCLYGKNFWYDENHAEMNKCLIRLHDDSGSFENRRFILIVQQGLKIPKTFHLKFHIMRQKVESTRNKRVWLDVRDFNIFSMDRRNLLKYIDKSVTHFSFGNNLYSPELLRATVLFEYIFNHLPNLEYLSINDAMLRKLDSVTDRDIPLGAMLPKLKTLRLRSPKFKFSTPFLLKILKRAPNLENIYGIPLQCLREIEVELEESGLDQILDSLKSVFIVRIRYTDGEIGALNFLADLSTLSRRSSHSLLEELDTRTFFVNQPQTRSQCMNMMTKILQLNDKTLKKIKLEPLGKVGFFEVPPLKNLKTLQFDMKRNATGLCSYFPRGFDVNKSFPNLNSVEITLDAKSGKNFSSHAIHNRYGEGSTPLTLLMKHFPTDLFIPGVTFKNIETLVLHRFTPFECIQNFSELFPNIRVLRINNSLGDIADVLPLCFGFWPQLQQLILEINNNTTFGNLDSVLTGIEKEKCRILSKAPIIPEQDQIERWISTHRTKLSICQLTELHLLKFLVRTPWNSAEQQEPIFTQVSALYGFGNHLMPNLKVQLGFDERVTSNEREKLLDSLLPALEYVSLC